MNVRGSYGKRCKNRASLNSAGMGLMSTVLVLALVGCGEQRFEPLIAPEFKLPLLDGSGHSSLSEYQGKVVYLSFWASWCLPCRQEMPYLSQLRARHHEDGFEVVAINVDNDPDLARAFVAEYSMDFPVLMDSERLVADLYRVPGYPTHFIVDRRGRIRFSGLGFDLKDVRAVTAEVATLVAEE